MINKKRKRNKEKEAIYRKIKNEKYFGELIEDYCARLKLDDIFRKQTASLIKTHTFGRQEIKSRVIALICYLMKLKRVKFDLEVILKDFCISPEYFNSSYKFVLRELNDSDGNLLRNASVPTLIKKAIGKEVINDSSKLIQFIKANFEFNNPIIERYLISLYERMGKPILYGRHGEIPAMIYIAFRNARDDLTQFQISKKLDITEVTIRKYFHSIVKKYNLVMID